MNEEIILSIKPYLESIRKVYDFISEKNLDISSFLIPFYNEILVHTSNENERPLLRLFLYFSFLEVVLATITKDDTYTLKNLILSDYIFLGRKNHFTVMSNFPRKYAEHSFFVKGSRQINVRKFCAQLIYEEKKRVKIEDIDLILNTVCEVNSRFADVLPNWHGILLLFDFEDFYSWDNKAHYIVEKFKYKDFYEKYKFLFNCEKSELISKLDNCLERSRGSFELPLINKVLPINEIAQY
ncbi:hypothetical protein BFS35_005675 [Macrococcoides goetzii]|uniref:Uncharacterized protein n=1 Tax=Macrococcoides goetzii TaxID=1891097 RepID=A0A395GBN8_9STAP|nr:hypothetical protein BFS35_005675 [Macrococcus goetzii]